jgi:hypothetical protein
MSVQWIEHNGVKIVIARFGAAKTKQEQISILENLGRTVAAAPGKVRILDDFNGAHGFPEFMDRAKQLGKEVFNAKRERAAFIGISGIQKILYNTYNIIAGNSIRIFENENDAFEYLAK